MHEKKEQRLLLCKSRERSVGRPRTHLLKSARPETSADLPEQLGAKQGELASDGSQKSLPRRVSDFGAEESRRNAHVQMRMGPERTGEEKEFYTIAKKGPA